MTENTTIQHKEKSKLYWLVHNLRKRLFSNIKGFAKKRPILFFFFLLFLLYLIFVNRDFIHPGVLFIRKYFIMVALVLSIAYLLFMKTNSLKLWKLIVKMIVLVGIGVLAFIKGSDVYKYIGLYIHYNNINKIELSEYPTTDYERIQPYNSIITLANQELLSETEEITKPHFCRVFDTLFCFTMCKGPSPEYSLQRLSKNMNEVVFVDAQLPSPSFGAESREKANFDVGEFLLFSKYSKDATLKSLNFLDYFTCEAGEPRFLTNNEGEWLQIVPLIRWEGWLFPRPVFGGAILFTQVEAKSTSRWIKRIVLGVGEKLSAQMCSELPWLKGQNLLPNKVSKFTAESFRFKNGFWAPFPGYHEGDIRIPIMPKDQNEQPFITYFNLANEGIICDYYGLEPYKEDKSGLNLSLFIPGDGREEVYFYDHVANQSAYMGSSAVASKIRESKKEYDWSSSYPAESRPFIKEIAGKKRFFWLSTVVTHTDDDKNGFIGGTVPEVTLTELEFSQVLWIPRDIVHDQKAWLNLMTKKMAPYWKISIPKEFKDTLKIRNEFSDSLKSSISDTVSRKNDTLAP